MKDTLNATNTESTNTLGWDTSDIFSANLMFPTSHFESEKDLNNLAEEEFSKFIISLLAPVQPLTNHERSEMAKSVKKGSRLRVYYQALEVVSRHLNIVNEVSSSVEDASISEEFGVHARVISSKEYSGELDLEDEAKRWLASRK